MFLVFLALEIGRSVVPVMTRATWREGSACWRRTYFVGSILSLACELSFTEGGGSGTLARSQLPAHGKLSKPWIWLPRP